MRHDADDLPAGDGASRPDDGEGTAPMGQESAERSALRGLVSAVTEFVVVVAMALAISLVVKTFLVQAFFIPSGSMEDTLLEDDRVVVSKLTPGPFDLDRGDIVVFKDPGDWLPPPVEPDEGPVRSALRTVFTFVGLLPHDSGEHLIKRVIGLPGDTVACCDDDGRLTVNGVPLDETYLYPGNVPSGTTFSETVPAGRLWVMGDHREISEDSRVHGTVPEDSVIGRAFVLVWPLDRATGLGRPEAVFDTVPEAAGSP
jgi:signal peptidase I